jgi:hypothetical protein
MESVLLRHGHTLANFIRVSDCDDGVAIECLEPGAALIVVTAHSKYRVIVLNPVRRTVLLWGGDQFPDPVPAILQGSTAGGNMVKSGWIGIGLRLEFCIGQRRIITSRVDAVSVAPPCDR